jgi:hypothetical protein
MDHALSLAYRKLRKVGSFALLRMTLGSSGTQFAIAENFSAQPTAPFEKFFRARGNSLIHPITRAAFLCSVKMNALNFKVLADQFIKIDSARHDIATD